MAASATAFRSGDGRPRGPGFLAPKRRDLPTYIAEKTRRGRALVEWLLAIADGSARASRQAATKEGGVVELEDAPTHRERLAAIRELWDRGMGSAIPLDKMPAPPEAETPDELGDLSLEPPPLSPDLEAALDEPARRGGDAGDPGAGNGGGA